MYRVLKFGGSSVASATNISRVLDIVEKEAAKGKVVLVSSAISGCTDALLSGDETQFQEMERRHRDIIKRLFTGEDRDTLQQRLDALFQEMRQSPVEEQVTFGEIFSTTILSAKLVTEGYKTVWLDSRELVIKDNEPLTYERINQLDTRHKMVEQVKEFNNFFIELCDRVTKDEFGIDAGVFRLFTSVLNEDVDNYLTAGINAFLSGRYEGADIIEDVPFFYPLVGIIRYNLLKNLCNDVISKLPS